MSGPVLFDGSILGAGPVTGVGRSFLYTLTAYAATAGRPCVLLVPDGVDAAALDLPGVAVEAGLPARGWRRRRALRAAAARLDPALLHSPVGALPRLACATVVTVHDVPWLYDELRGEPGTRPTQRLALRRAVRHSTVVLVPSAATLRDVRRCHPAGGDVRVVPHGVPLPEAPAPEADLRGPFVVLGDDRPRKNHARLREAHARAAARCADLPPLRFIGPPHDYLAEPDKVAALRAARALLHPALLEGFGLPVVEAFGHGVPVVCSDRAALPEVAGGAALLVDPTDVAALADAILRVHRDAALRRDLRARGRARAAELVPDRTAEAWRALHAELDTI